MTCGSCGHDNPDGARFCVECGSPIASRCPNCAVEIEVPANFCPQCGQDLSLPDPPRPERRADVFDDAERRHISVLFCDLVASTELAQKVDPEDLRELVRAYQQACEEIVRDLDGQVAQYLGDGILIYFGAENAHEDDPVRAVRAALQIVDAIPAINDRLARRFPQAGSNPLQVRAAVHSGHVVVGSLGAEGQQTKLALGDAVNTAARIMDLAGPGTVLISHATRRLVPGMFELRELGPKSLKGISDPVPVSQVLRTTGIGSRQDLVPARGHTPLVGRDQEVGLLLDRWDQVLDGHGQAVLLNGEAGIGKSRLVRVLREKLSDEQYTWLECRCSEYRQSSALHPIVELLRAGIPLAREDSADEQLAKLENAITSIGFEVPDVLPPLASLLSIPHSERTDGDPAPSAEAQRRQTLEVLSRWLFALVEIQPLVLVVEDLHWCDPTTLELIGSVIEQAPTGALLLVMTFRPEFTPPWHARSHLAQLPLHALTKHQMGVMIDTLRGDTPLPAEICAQIMARTDGVPLFVEEFTKAVLESEWPLESSGPAAPLPDLEIPSSLQASLMARIDRLGAAHRLAQLCSVLGREFSHELLESASDRTPEELEQQIGQLTEAELIYQRGVPPRAVYTFKHALIQDIAYQSQLRRRRQQLHARIAALLEERFPETAAAEPELAARHHEEAGQLEQAAAYYLRAGERATEQAANDEAIEHLKRGIALLADVPETPERDRKELELQVALGVPLQAAKGNADPEVEAVYERARKLCRGAEDAPSLFRALRGLFAARQVRGELESAIELGKQLLELADRGGRASEQLQAHLALGSPYLYLGRFSNSLAHLEPAMALYDPAEHRSLAFLYGLDQGVNSRAYASLALFALGRPEQAESTSRAAVKLARDLAHPYSLATALAWAAILHQWRREPEVTRERAEEALSLSREYGYPTYLGLGMCFRGWSISQDDGEAGIAECREGLGHLASAGTSVGGAALLGVLCDANRRAGRLVDASSVVDTALDLSHQTGQVLLDAELHRLKGELLIEMHGPQVDAAGAQFHEAVEIARSQRAKSYELRASMSLGRWLSQRGEPGARSRLAAVYSEFSEGFDTPDLREARALLETWA